MEYYNWQRTLSHSDALAYMVIGAKGVGKTFGARKLCIEDFLKSGARFGEISRHKDESEDVSAGYFEKLAPFFPEWQFKTDNRFGYIAPACGEDETPDWSVCCYFIALSTFQKSKRKNYVNVRTLLFDEFIIDSRDRYHRYIRNEYGILCNVVDSVLRETPDGSGKIDKRILLMANACDLTCPHLEGFGIKSLPKQFGYSRHKRRKTLLHYVDPAESAARATDTLVGWMVEGTDEGSMMFGNEFVGLDGGGFIESKSKGANYYCGFAFNGHRFAIWLDKATAVFYVTKKFPKKLDTPLYFLVMDDGRIDYQAIRRNEKICRMLGDLHYKGLLRYDSAVTREMFKTLLKTIGVL